MGNCQNSICFPSDKKEIILVDNKIYQAYMNIKILNDDIKSSDIFKKDKIYLIFKESISYFVNTIEKFAKLENKEIQEQLEQIRFPFNFDELTIIDKENFETNEEFIIVNEKFFEILDIKRNIFDNKSVIINKENNITQIEFVQQKKKKINKINELNFCYKFEERNNNANVIIFGSNNTVVEENILNLNQNNNH